MRKNYRIKVEIETNRPNSNKKGEKGEAKVSFILFTLPKKNQAQNKVYPG